MFKLINFILAIISFSFSYEVGETISMTHQNMGFDICYAPELDPNNDGVFQFAEYNGKDQRVYEWLDNVPEGTENGLLIKRDIIPLNKQVNQISISV